LSLICGYSAVEAEITVSSHHIIVAYRRAISVSTRRTEIAARCCQLFFERGWIGKPGQT
jgi:hypothetical protein